MKKTTLLVNDICRLTPELLRGLGIKAVLADLDNTLAGYGSVAAGPDVTAWIGSLRDAGIPLMVVSNARPPRVEKFCAPFGLPYLARAGKPRGKGLREAARRLGAPPTETVMAGDQFFTDVLAARNAGMRAVLVSPRVKGFWFTLRRLLEKPFIRGEKL